MASYGSSVSDERNIELNETAEQLMVDTVKIDGFLKSYRIALNEHELDEANILLGKIRSLSVKNLQRCDKLMVGVMRERKVDFENSFRLPKTLGGVMNVAKSYNESNLIGDILDGNLTAHQVGKILKSSRLGKE